MKHLEETNTNIPDHKHTFYKRIENLTNIHFTTEETNLLKKKKAVIIIHIKNQKNWTENIALEARTAIGILEPNEQYVCVCFVCLYSNKVKWKQ
jgi:hypothetical protein